MTEVRHLMKRSLNLIVALPRTIAANPRLLRAVKRAFLWRDCRTRFGICVSLPVATPILSTKAW